MLKPIAMLLVFALCSLLGIRSAAGLRQRTRLLAALQSSIKRLMIRMEYEKKPLALIVSDRAQGELRPLWQTFAKELTYGTEPRAAFSAALEAADAQIAGFHTIGRQERELLTEFAAALGGTELDGQKRNAEMLLAGLAPLGDRANSEYSTKSRIYRTMGMLCGAVAVILML